MSVNLMKKKVLILLLCSISSLYAVNLAPLVQKIDSLENTRLVYSVSNATNRPIPVEVSIKEVIGVENHKEIRVDTDDIVLSHEQFILSGAPSLEELKSSDETVKQLVQSKLSKSKKTIRVEYIGEKVPKRQKVYRIIAKEPDIPGLVLGDQSSEQNSAAVKIKFQMEGLIFVGAKNARPHLYLDSIKLHQGKGSFVLKNKGDGSMFLQIVRDPKSKKLLSGIKVILENGVSYFLRPKDFKNSSFKRVLPDHEIRYVFTYNKNHSIKKLELVLPKI